MSKFVGVRVNRAIEIIVLNHGEQQALSIDRDLEHAENVKALRSTLVMLYRATAPLSSAVSSTSTITGFGCTRLSKR
jgi:hypothetical protein